MTDLEISKALALAIGWHETRVITSYNYVRVQFDTNLVWRVFDYRDWNVIGPIAERYDCFPAIEPHSGEWFSFIESNPLEFADTPQKSIALAVIEGVKV